MMGSIVRLAIVVAAAGVLLVPGRVAAQAPAGVVIGDTVRIGAPALGPGIRGELVAVRGDTLFVRRFGATLAVPMAQVERIEVRRRRSLLNALGLGVAYGAPLGLASGFLVATSIHGGGNPDCADDCNLLPVAGAATGLAVGTVLGGLIGISSPLGRWVRVSPRPSVAVGPGAGGRGVALSLDVKL
jgi:hypothetical protein